MINTIFSEIVTIYTLHAQQRLLPVHNANDLMLKKRLLLAFAHQYDQTFRCALADVIERNPDLVAAMMTNKFNFLDQALLINELWDELATNIQSLYESYLLYLDYCENVEDKYQYYTEDEIDDHNNDYDQECDFLSRNNELREYSKSIGGA